MLDRILFGLTLYKTKTKWYLAPYNDQVDEILVLNAQTGKIEKQPSAESLPNDAVQVSIQAFAGTIRLLTSWYAIVFNECEPVAELADHRIFSVKRLQFLRICEDARPVDDLENSLNEKFIQMVREASAAQQLYCSCTYDLSRSVQENYSKPEKQRSIWSVDSDFVWNWNAMADTLAVEGLQRYVMPVMNGYIFDHNINMHYILLSRRSWRRAGMRYFRRGIDDDGIVANSVQTEQIITTEPMSSEMLSHVQIRGSIPLYWTQKPNLMYRPLPVIHSFKDQKAPFDKHLKQLKDKYGHITVISLIDHKGSEANLSRTYRSLANQDPIIIYREFDFHHQCGSGDDRLKNLLQMLQHSIDYYGYCVVDIHTQKISMKQTGIIRTNCIDSLDRTNVAQCLIGKTVLETQIRSIRSRFDSSGSGQLTKPISLESYDSYFHRAFMNGWANNADTLSMQYTGTPAMKTDYTRSGRRTYEGMLNDGYHSVLRYLYNNFGDGYRQDAVDLLVGNYVIGKEPLAETALRTARPADRRLLLLLPCSVICLLMIMVNISGRVAPSSEQVINVMFWTCGLGASLCAILICGDSIADFPKFSPVD